MESQHHTAPTTNIPTTNPNNKQSLEDYALDWSSLAESEGKNKNKILCPKCSSVILDKSVGVHVEIEKLLPSMSAIVSSSESSFENSNYIHFWMVDDIFKFENCGFSNTVDSTKYLTCADCEVGPIGFQDLNNKHCYVCLARVVNA